MGYWVNTTYVNYPNTADVAIALTRLCQAEGLVGVAAPLERERLLVEPMQYDSALNNDLWGLAIFPGAPSWTVIQTAPLELLAERSPVTSRMRLADLCSELSVSAFQLNVYDSIGVVLAEISKQGEIAISGFNSQAEDPFEWNGERLSEERFETQFQLHPFQELIAGITLGKEAAKIIAKQFGAANLQYCDNVVSVDTLISHKPFAADGGSVLYFKWPGKSRQRYAPAASWDEYRKAVDN